MNTDTDSITKAPKTELRTLNISTTLGDKVSAASTVLKIGVRDITEEALNDWFKRNSKRLKAATDSFHSRMATVLN